MPPRHLAYVLQKPFKDELKQLQQQDITTPIDLDETAEWCNIFILVAKPNGKVILFLYLVRLNQALFRQVHRGSTLKDIFPKLNNVKYLFLIHVSSCYHNLKLGERLSYLTTLHANLVDTDNRDCCLKQPPQGMWCKER